MKTRVAAEIERQMNPLLTNEQALKLREVLARVFCNVAMEETSEEPERDDEVDPTRAFLAAKRVEGCSSKSLNYYRQTIETALETIGKKPQRITTDDLRQYLIDYQERRGVGKVTLDNIRRILSSYFAWLEDENFIVKSPARRIHKVKAAKVVKEVYTDEMLETMRDSCRTPRDLALIDMLSSTGMRVGELVALDRADVDFVERECVVLGKGSKERTVYFDARTKIHLQNYLASRTDDLAALFVTQRGETKRLTIGAIETYLRKLGRRLDIPKVHPHKFRRTLATNAIDKGMPIEQVQQLLGHQKIDTTLHYALVKQHNVKLAHRKFIA